MIQFTIIGRLVNSFFDYDHNIHFVLDFLGTGVYDVSGLIIKREDIKLKCVCKKCGHKWLARTKKPRSCPACKVYSWDKDKKKKGGVDAKNN